MADQKDLLSREIDEELRREQMLKLWEQYGVYAIGLALLVIVGVGGVKYYEHRTQLAAEAAGAKFIAALKDFGEKRTAEAQKELQGIAANAPRGYATLARLRMATADQAAGKTAEAATAFEAIAKESGVDPLLADYARLQAAMLRVDTASFTDMQNRLNDLTAEKSPWRYNARELLGLAAYKAGKLDDARQQYLQLVTDRGTPAGVAERARVMMSMLTEAVAATETPPAKPEAAENSVKAKEVKADETKAVDTKGDKKGKTTDPKTDKKGK